MTHHRRIRGRRGRGRLRRIRIVASSVLVSLCAGLTPAAATASTLEPGDLTTTTSAAGTAAAPVDESPLVSPGPAPVAGEFASLLVALASAHRASSVLDGIGGRLGSIAGERPGTPLDDEGFMRDVEAHVERVRDILRQPQPPPPLPVQLDKLIAMAQALRDDIVASLPPKEYVVGTVDEAVADAEETLDAVESMVPDRGDVLETYDAVYAEVMAMKALADQLADELTIWAMRYVDDAIAAVPTPDELIDLAHDLEAFARGEATKAEQTLLAELARLRSFLDDPETTRPVRQAVTTVLLSLGNVVNPLPDGLAPTAELTVNAAGTIVSWADGLLQQPSDAPSPLYDSVDTDTDEPQPAPTDDLRVVDSDVVVAEEPVAVPGAVHWTAGPPEDHAGATYEAPDEAPAPSVAGVDCGRFAGRRCYPPMQNLSQGRVIHRPIVRVVLVGSWWRTQGDMTGGLDTLFSSMGDSGYQNIMRQYHDRSGYVGADVTYQGMHVLDVAAPPTVSPGQAGAYAARAAREHAGWATSDRVVWVVALPPSAVSDVDRPTDDTCGYQTWAMSGDRRYTLAVVDHPREETDTSRARCMFVRGNRRGSLTAIAAHEYAGAVTNPDGDGWRDQIGNHLPDLCEARFIRGPGGEWVTKLWSNADQRCVSTFTPRFAYEVIGVTAPLGDTGPGSTLTRGHAYAGAQVEVRNSGNMPWLSTGGKTTYLGTADNECSPFADRVGATTWASCRRIRLSARHVNPGTSTTIPFTVRPDGSLDDGAPGLTETFRMVAGSTWMDNTGSISARLSGIRTAQFSASVVAAPDVGYVAVGAYGTDTTVRVTLRNDGTAYWYPNEVLYIGTPDGEPSEYAATSWPRGLNGCTACRAHRIGKLVPPNGTYGFDLTLHIPAARTAHRLVTFYPFADVRRMADGDIVPTRLKGARIAIQVVSLPKPVTAREVTGYGFASAGNSTGMSTAGFTCVAAAGADAVSTTVSSCVAHVTTPSGATWTASAPVATANGRLAATRGALPGYDSGGGDTVVVCWVVESAFLDGTTTTHQGCT